MKLKMVVIRSAHGTAAKREAPQAWMETKSGHSDFFTRGFHPGTSGASIEVHSPELSTAEVRDQARDPSVLAVAPEMPMQLVKPMATANEASPDPSPPNDNWGLLAVGARRSGLTGEGVTVAVLDTGIVQAHPAFEGVDFQPDQLMNFTDDVDDDIDGHGTHCAGTILGRRCFDHEIGVAPGVSRLLVGKVIGKGGGTTEAIFRAILWAQERRAHIVAMSLGMDYPGYQRYLVEEHGMEEEHATSLALAGYRANLRLFDRISQVATGVDNAIPGCVVVAAAGNESKRPKYTITVAPPAAADQFLSVGAIGGETGDYRIAPFSNDGVRLVAPGVDIWSADKEWTTDKSKGLCRKSGTSMAVPHVAGVAALWAERLMRSRRFNARAVKESVERGALKLPPFEDSDVGLGLVQAPPPSATAASTGSASNEA